MGLPFMPVLAQPIDLFPYTAHCELVMLMERVSPESSPNPPASQGTASTDSPLETSAKYLEMDESDVTPSSDVVSAENSCNEKSLKTSQET